MESEGVTQPIGVVYVPVDLARCNGVIRFTVVEQDVPPPLPVGIMRTLQASLDLNDDGDKVIFRQFGGESSLRTLQSGHTVIRADQFDPDVGSSQKSRNCARTTMKDAQQITCQSSLMCTRDPYARTTMSQQETMTQHPHAVADHGRKQHRTTTDPPDLIRPIFPPTVTKRRGNTVMCCERCEMCWNRWYRILQTMVERNPEMKLNNRTLLASTRKRPVEIESFRCPLLSTRTWEHDDTGHAVTESSLGMLDEQYHLRTQPGRVRCSTFRPGEFRRCRREHGSIGDDKTPCL